MPVIRQKRQFGTANIGVVNMNSGASQMWETVSNVADRFSQIAFEASARKAKQTAEDYVASMTQEDLFSIDPDTGKYSSLNAPSSYGQIAADAHRVLIRNKFVQSIDDELQRVGQEMASKYSSGQYKEMMSKHVESMIKAAQSSDGEDTPFSAPISDVGYEYVSRTTAALRKKEVAAQKKSFETAAVLRLYNLETKLDGLSALGQFGKEYQQAYQEYEQLNQSLFQSSGNGSQYNNGRKSLKGIEARAASGKLVPRLTAMNDDLLTSKVIRYLEGDSSALASIEDKDIRTDVVNFMALTGGDGADSLIRTIQGADKQLDQQRDIELNNALSEFGEVSIDDTPEDLNRKAIMIASKSPSASVDDLKDVQSSLVLKKFELMTTQFESEEINKFQQDLLSGTFSESRGLFGQPQQAEMLFNSLNAEDRDSLSKLLASKYTLETRAEASVQQNAKDNFAAQIGGFIRGGDIEDYEGILNQIKMSPLDDKQPIINALDGALANKLINFGQSIVGLTPNDVDAIRIAVSNGFVPEDASEELAQKAEYFIKAAKINPSAVRTAIGGMKESANAQQKKDLAKLDLALATDAISLGTANLDQVKTYQEANGLDQIPVSEMIVQDEDGVQKIEPTIKGLIDNGYLPTQLIDYANSLSNGIVRDEQTGNIAFQIFEAAMNNTDSFGNNIDLLEGSVDPKAYAIISESIMLSRQGFGNPVSVMAQLSNFDGSIDGELKQIVDDGSKQKTLDALLGKYMSDGRISSSQLSAAKSVIRLNYANRNIRSVDDIESIIQNHFENVGTQDKSIYGAGYQYGEKNTYSRYSFEGITANNMAAAEREMLQSVFELRPDAFEADAMIDRSTDFVIDSILGPLTSSAMVWRSMFGTEFERFEDWKYQDTEYKISLGVERLQGNLLYKPIESSFVRDPQTGKFISGRYIVGLEGNNGGFIPITLPDGRNLEMSPMEYQNKTAWWSLSDIPETGADPVAIKQKGARWRAAGEQFGYDHPTSIQMEREYYITLPTYKNPDGTINEFKLNRQLQKKHPNVEIK